MSGHPFASLGWPRFRAIPLLLFRLFAACFAFAVCGTCGLGPSGRANETSTGLHAAIDYAQARTVKLYGAGIGREPGYGTGILVSGEGHILTANGIYLSGERLRVVLPRGEVFFGQVERRSTPWQLALVRIPAKTPDYFEIPTTSLAEPGDWVLAVSNAFGVATGSEPLSVSRGVLSARVPLNARRGAQEFPYQEEALLFDMVTSNSGAAGGALISAEGRLLGMLGKIVEDERQQTRVNYAVPAEILARFVAGETGPKVAAAAAGPLSAAGRGIHLFSLGGKQAPAYVDRVATGSRAAQAGLKPDDLILAVAGRAVPSVAECESALRLQPAATTIELVVKRKMETLTLRLPAAESGP